MAAQFTTDISRVEPGEVRVRGYDIRDIIAHATFTEAAFLVLQGRRPTPAELRVTDAILCCCVEHGLVNTLSVAGRYVVSGSASLPTAIAAGALSFGPHTGTAHLTGAMLREIEADIAAGADRDAAVERAVLARRERGESVPGLGHPVHRDTDPRTVAVLAVAREEGMADDLVALLEEVRATTSRVVGRELVLNVDGLMGALMLHMGFSVDAMLAINILTAVPGIAAHAIEEMESGRPLRYPPDHADSYTMSRDARPWESRA